MGIFTRIADFFRGTPVQYPAAAPVQQRETTAASTPRTGGSLIYTFDSNAALCVATVFRCVTLLAESVANLPMQYMRYKDGIFTEDTASRLHYLLAVQPDKHLSSYDFWQGVVIEMLLEGNAYVVPTYSPVTMDFDRLALCGRGTVSHNTITDTYVVCDINNGIYGVYDESEILHFKRFSLDGKTGLSTLAYARMTTSISSTASNEMLNRFANGGNVRGLVTNETSVRGFGEYQDTELTKLAADIDSRFRNGERIVSIPGQADFKQLTLNSTDMQFLETLKFNVREVCRFFSVHPSFVFDDTSNNYKSAEMANVAFLSHSLNPILRKIESELLRKLVAPSLCCKRKFQFDRESLYACDLDSRVKYQSQTIAAGLYTVNEWRQKENKPPVEGGDKVLISANLRGINEVSAPAQEPAQEPQDKEPQNKQEDGEEE